MQRNTPFTWLVGAVAIALGVAFALSSRQVPAPAIAATETGSSTAAAERPVTTAGAAGDVAPDAAVAARPAAVAMDPVDRALPAFSLATLAGDSVDTAALAGKPWVVNFWATWCPPCVEELPALNAMWAALEPAGFGMLAINVGEPPEAIGAFLERVPIDFPVLLGHGATTLPDWGARGLPTTLVVDAAGRVVLAAEGPRDWDDPALIERLTALAGD